MIAQENIANTLLAALLPHDFVRLAGRAHIVSMEKGHDLILAGQHIDTCWFPLAGLASVIALDDTDAEAEVGIVGHDGFLSVATILGGDRNATRTLVQVSGTAMRMEAQSVKSLMQDSAHFSRLMLAYVEAFSVQVASSALAYARYPIQRRLARWLLMCGDRVGPDNITLTHEALSIMLGVRRAGVTVALHQLEKHEAITMHRGTLSISDRQALLVIAGAGYGLPESEYRRLLDPARHPH